MCFVAGDVCVLGLHHKIMFLSPATMRHHAACGEPSGLPLERAICHLSTQKRAAGHRGALANNPASSSASLPTAARPKDPTPTPRPSHLGRQATWAERWCSTRRSISGCIELLDTAAARAPVSGVASMASLKAYSGFRTQGLCLRGDMNLPQHGSLHRAAPRALAAPGANLSASPLPAAAACPPQTAYRCGSRRATLRASGRRRSEQWPMAGALERNRRRAGIASSSCNQ